MASSISVQDLTKVYDLGEVQVRALRGVTLDIEAGEFVAVIGPSGSGKSTFMHILGCLDRPTSGSYRVRDREVSDLEDDDLSELRSTEFGFIFQSYNLIPQLNVDRLSSVFGEIDLKPLPLRFFDVLAEGLRAVYQNDQLPVAFGVISDLHLESGFLSIRHVDFPG